MSQLQRMVANMSALVRTDTFEGEEHFVLPTILMKETVMNDLFYSQDEIDKFPKSWNGRPIPVFHPEEDGQNVSANDPDIIEQQTIGTVFNCYIDSNDHKLKGESWINKAKCKEISPVLFDMIERGANIEVSTGLFTENDGIAGNHNGTWYKGSALNFRPDHLAVLPGGIGAMSWADGAGMPRVNQQEGEGDEMTLEELARRFASNQLSENAEHTLSHDDLWKMLNNMVHEQVGITAFVIDVFDEVFVYDVDTPDGFKLFSQGYTVTNDIPSFVGDPVEVMRKTQFVPVTNESEEGNGEGADDQSPATNKEDLSMDRTKLIDALIANSDWTEEDRSDLVAMSDEAFAGVSMQKPEANADGEDGGGAAEGEGSDGAEGAGEGEGEGEGEGADGAPARSIAPDTNADAEETVEQVLANVKNPEVRETLNRAVTRDKEIKANMIKELTSNKECSFTANELQTHSIDQLDKLLKLSGSAKTADDFSAQAPAAPVVNENEGVPKMPLAFPKAS